MSEDESRSLANLKKRLQERADQLQSEGDLLREAIAIIDDRLAGMSFKRASELPVTPSETPQAVRRRPEPGAIEEHMPLTYKGTELGKVHLSGETMIIEPESSLELTTATRPFETFFIRNILEGIREADTVSVANKKLRPDQILSYDLEVEGPFIRKIMIRNVGGRERVRRIINAAGWTISTMVQNMQKQSGGQTR